MKTVVLFGDSNTWGYVPGGDGARYPREIRWAGRLAASLADQAEVIAEGLCSRTAAMDLPTAEGLNGLSYLVPCLRSHMPVDALVIFLGTNDVAYLTLEDVAESVGRLVKAARTCEAGPRGTAPAVLVVCPPPFGEHVFSQVFADMCAKLSCELLDLGDVTGYVTAGDDWFHLDEAGHAAVAAAVEESVRRLIA